MGIERLQHAVDGTVDEAIGFDRLGVVGLNGAEGGGKRFVVIGEPIFGRKCASSEYTAGQGGQENGEGGSGQGLILAHDRMLTD